MSVQNNLQQFIPEWREMGQRLSKAGTRRLQLPSNKLLTRDAADPDLITVIQQQPQRADAVFLLPKKKVSIGLEADKLQEHSLEVWEACFMHMVQQLSRGEVPRDASFKTRVLAIQKALQNAKEWKF